MNESLRSILEGTAPLSLGAVVALLLTVLRRPIAGDLAARERTALLFLTGLAVQSLHFTEVLKISFRPCLASQHGPRTSSSFHLIWLAVWILSAPGLFKGYRFALFQVWFFAIAAVANGIAHPMLAVSTYGNFPGLITSPVLGGVGVLLLLRLLKLTGVATA